MSAHVVGIDLFGGFRVTVDGRAVPDEDWRRRHAAALVKLLALSAGHRLHRERVAAALWPDAGLGEAAPRLHKAAHYARRVLGVPDAVVLAGDVVSLVPTGRVEVDTERFERLADAALAGRDPTAAGVAADACPGPLLPDDLYEEWTEEPRERLRLRRAEVLRLAGRWEELAAADPADEQAAVALARRLAAAGDRPAALRQF